MEIEQNTAGNQGLGKQNEEPPASVRFNWRSSYWFQTMVVGLGLTVDMLTFSIVTPALPFQLQKLGYTDISSLVGWLLFSQNIGLVLATLPIASFSEHFKSRRLPMIACLIILIGSQALLMEARTFQIMLLARFVQGIGSSGVWVVGMALMCEEVPEHLLGRQLGRAMSGLSIGVAAGPPIGGFLYSYFGFRAPIIFAMGLGLIDLLGRSLIVCNKQDEKVTPPVKCDENNEPITNKDPQPQKSSILALWKLSKSSRAIVTLFVVFIYGTLHVGRDPSIVLHLHEVWNLDSKIIGLMFLIASFANFFASILAGEYIDHYGVEGITSALLLLTCPCWGILAINGPLELFVAAFSVEYFLSSGVFTALSTELANISTSVGGIGYAHVLGISNIAYSLGALVGPVVIGAIYDHIKKGWMIISLASLGLMFFCFLLSFCWIGARPLWNRLLHFNIHINRKT